MTFHVASDIRERLKRRQPEEGSPQAQRQVLAPTEEEIALKRQRDPAIPVDRCGEKGCSFPALVAGGYCRHHGRMHEGDASMLAPEKVGKEWSWIAAWQPRHAEQP